MQEIKQEIVSTDYDDWLRNWSSEAETILEVKVERTDIKIEKDKDIGIERSKREASKSESMSTAVQLKTGCLNEVAVSDEVKHVDKKGPDLHPSGLEDEIGNLCHYQCPTCKKSYRQYATVKRHIRTSQSCTNANMEQCLVRPSYYRCRVCKRDLLNDCAMFKDHVKQHKMTLQEYCERYRVKKLKTIKHNNLDSLQEELKGVDSAYSDTVGCLCKFKCAVCDEEFDNFSKMRKHQNELRHVDESDRGMKKMVTKLTWHKCRICQESVVCDPMFVHRHLKFHHKMQVNTYVDKFKLRNQISFRRVQERIDSIFAERGEMSEAVGNLCRFRCRVCHREFHSVSGLNSHMTKRSHGAKVYERGEAIEFSTRLVGHKCRICQTNLLNDDLYLSSHFIAVHKLKSVKDYCKKHGVRQIVLRSTNEGEA